MINAMTEFGIVADGSDETSKINQAVALASGEEAGELVYFPPGVYGCDGLDAINTVATFKGAALAARCSRTYPLQIAYLNSRQGPGWVPLFRR